MRLQRLGLMPVKLPQCGGQESGSHCTPIPAPTWVLPAQMQQAVSPQPLTVHAPIELPYCVRQAPGKTTQSNLPSVLCTASNIYTHPCAHLGAACTDAAGCVSATAGTGACAAAGTGACAGVLAGAAGALAAGRGAGLKSANRAVP